ncbi:HtaA domain-containing protein [Dactylosporangium sp. NPDC005572]|uniref:HtaA domain-containing protein n=1 Tax=Dactylosporangium sp. NPDC005572 TaxID=3156889 RepID=UPI0033A426FE
MRASLVEYVEAAGGTITVQQPATRLPDGRFRYPFAARAGGVVQFSGAVVLSAHHGALHLEIAEPWLEPVDGGEHVLSVRGSRLTDSEGGRLRIALVDEAGDAWLAPGAEVAFDFRYPAGAPLDAVAMVAA